MKNTREDNVAKLVWFNSCTELLLKTNCRFLLYFCQTHWLLFWTSFSFLSMLAWASALNLINYNDLVPLGQRLVKHVSALLLFARSYPLPESPCNPGLSLSLRKSLFRAKALTVYLMLNTQMFFSICHHLNTVFLMIKQHWAKAGSPPSAWSVMKHSLVTLVWFYNEYLKPRGLRTWFI